MHCNLGSRGHAYLAAYEDFWSAHPIEVRVEAVSMQDAAALVGESFPDTAEAETFVAGFRFRLPHPPPGVRWNVSAIKFIDYYPGDNPAKVSYDHPNDPEGFVIALGGTPRPSTLRIAENRGMLRDEIPLGRASFSDGERYGIEQPPAQPAPAHSGGGSPRLGGGDVIVLAMLATPLAIVGVLNALGSKSQATSPAFERYLRAIDAARRAENAQWAKDAGVAARVRLWQGAWERPMGPDTTEFLLTYGVERRRWWNYHPPHHDREYKASVFAYIHPQIGDRVLMPIVVHFEIPRRGDLPDDLAAKQAEGWLPVERRPSRGPSWDIELQRLSDPTPPPI